MRSESFNVVRMNMIQFGLLRNFSPEFSSLNLRKSPSMSDESVLPKGNRLDLNMADGTPIDIPT
jgi:hypothetical protein